MSIVLKNKTGDSVNYTAQRVDGATAVYVGPGITDVKRDTLLIKTTDPKRSMSSYGNRRSVVNLLRAADVVNPASVTEVRDFKFALDISLPVNMTESDVDESIARLAELFAQPDLLKRIIRAGVISH